MREQVPIFKCFLLLSRGTQSRPVIQASPVQVAIPVLLMTIEAGAKYTLGT